MVPPSSLILSSPWRWMGPQATCEGCMAWPCGRHSHPPSPGRVFFTRPSTDCHAIVYPGHASCPGRWRALSEVPFGRSPGRNKLRSQAAGQDMQFYASLERRQPPPPCPLLVCALGEQERPTALMSLLPVRKFRPAKRSRIAPGGQGANRKGISQNYLAGLQKDFERDFFALIGVEQLHI